MRDWAFAKLTKKRDEAQCAYYVCSGCHVFDLSYPKHYFEKSIDLPFEDTKFPVNAEYDAYLRDYYGDYMQLPPENERGGHGDIIVDLDHDYTTYRKGGKANADKAGAL